MDYIDVVKIIRNTKSTTCFTDPYPARMIKEKLNVLSILLRIINHSLNSGTEPEEWKTASILLLIKKVGSLEYNNYHPINNCTFISNIVEKCLVKQLMKYCNQCELFPSYLSVYRDHHSKKTILLKLVNDMLMNMDNV